jgi:alpha-L-fucosidase
MSYQMADFAPLAESGYGVGLHWTTATMPREGEPVPYEQAVAQFDVPRLVEQLDAVGAGHLLLTSTHSKHTFPCPHPVVDEILPGRTCERDLLGELADALSAAGKRFIVYYNSGTHAGDPQWREASGADNDPERFFENWQEIIGHLGERYGSKMTAWWFDGGYELEDIGERMGGTPWADLTRAAKAGHADRLICYNPGIENLHSYTERQDYWAGEVCRLNYIPRGERTPMGLPWYAFVSWHGDSRKPRCGHWVMDAENRELPWRSPPAEAVAPMVREFRAAGGAVTFNVFCYQDGSIYDTDLATLTGLGEILTAE